MPKKRKTTRSKATKQKPATPSDRVVRVRRKRSSKTKSRAMQYKGVDGSIKVHGGKNYLSTPICELMAGVDHNKFLESHAGGLRVLMRKEYEGIAEWACDTNGAITNFWKVMQSRTMFHDFHDRVQCVPFSEVEFADAHRYHEMVKAADGKPPDAVDWAVSFFVRSRQSRQGLKRDYCTPTKRTRRGMNEQVSAWLTAVDGLVDVHQRLRRVEIWTRPAIEAIRKLDSPKLLVYSDPPYLHGTRQAISEYGPFEMTDDDHEELLQCLAGMKGHFLLSGYRSELYDTYTEKHDWYRIEFDLPNNASAKRTLNKETGKKEKERKIECVWMNFAPPKNIEGSPK